MPITSIIRGFAAYEFKYITDITTYYLPMFINVVERTFHKKCINKCVDRQK